MSAKLISSDQSLTLYSVFCSSPLTQSDVFYAVEQFYAANGIIDSYNDSTDYDLIVDGKHYPPKPIFGLALSKLTGTTVKSNHFTGGKKSPCFITLQRLGFDIVEKGKLKLFVKMKHLSMKTLLLETAIQKPKPWQLLKFHLR